ADPSHNVAHCGSMIESFEREDPDKKLLSCCTDHLHPTPIDLMVQIQRSAPADRRISSTD
ncbi:MAG: hypothetical protein AAF466_12245, partial [Bacteroidota bacterium]